MKQSFFLYKSTNPYKKYMVRYLNESTGKINTIHFGSSSYSDYTINKDKKRKELYRIRHASDNINNLKYPGCWSWHLLWNKKSLEKSIEDMNSIFNIHVYKEY